MAEDVFTNVQLLRGIPVKEFMGTMGFFSAATGMNCTQCHVEESGGSWARYADDTPLKQTARRMIVMMNAINRTYFGGRRVVTCYSCHRGVTRPEVIPDLALQYGEPVLREPDEVVQQAPGDLRPIKFLTSTSRRSAGPSGLPTSPALSPRGATRSMTISKSTQ